jgi:sugar lactone lactonase YvrE
MWPLYAPFDCPLCDLNLEKAKAVLGRSVVLVILVLLSGLFVKKVQAQIQPPFDTSYTLTNLGQAPGVPGSYGGLTFLDANNLLLSGCSEDYGCSGAIYKVGVTRDAQGHLTGFSGPTLLFSSASSNESGLAFRFGGLLFYTAIPSALAEVKTGSSTSDKTTDLSTRGVCAPYIGGLQFAPNGDLKATSFTCGDFYTLPLSPDGTNTFDVTNTTPAMSLKSSPGPEAFVYVPTGSPQFAAPSLLVTDWVGGTLSAWQVDSNYVPISGTSQTFANIGHAFGAALDPVTHDLLVSTWDYGTGSVQVISGFAQPTWTGAIINTVAGNGTFGYSGDGGPATSARLEIYGMAVDRGGSVFIGDANDHRVRRVDATTRIITTVAGNGTFGYGGGGDGGLATSAGLVRPEGVAVDGAGNLFIADSGDNRIRRVDATTGIITTVAGNGTGDFSGDGGAATSASLDSPVSVAVDGAGNLFIADENNDRIRRVDAGTGIITTVAGTGTSGYNGDNIGAVSADLWSLSSITVDATGNLFIADVNNDRIRRVDAGTGIITTVAGTGTSGYNGDNIGAVSADLWSPSSITVDAAGNLFFADATNLRIRRVDAVTGVITTVAGNGGGTQVFSGDGGPATDASLYLRPTLGRPGTAVDGAGNLFIADSGNNRIRRVGIINASVIGTLPTTTTLAASSNPATWNQPLRLTATVTAPSGGTPTGTVSFQQGTTELGTSSLTGGQTSLQTTFTQTGTYSITATYSGDSAFAPSTSEILTQSVTAQTTTTLSSSQNPSFAGELIQLTASVTTPDGGIATGTLTIYDGTNVLASGSVSNSSESIKIQSLSVGSRSITAVYSGDINYLGSTSTVLTQIVSAGVASSDGNLKAVIPAFGSVPVGSNASQSILLSNNTSLTLTNISANGDFTVTNNGCLLNVSLKGGTACTLTVQFAPSAAGQRWFQLTVQDANGDIYDFGLEGVGLGATLAFTPGITSTAAGNGAQGNTGDGGPATSASLGGPTGVAVDALGNLYIADPFDASVRKVDVSTGTISTVAGNGSPGFSGDGGPATAASLTGPYSVTLDPAGNLFIAEIGGHRVRKVDGGTGVITTVAGTGTSGFSGDGGPATSATLNSPAGVTVDTVGNLYIADSDNQRIRKVDASTGIITTIAGNGVFAFGGDGGAATSASLASPYGLATDSDNNLYIADRYNQRVRKVDGATGNISTVAGNGVSGFAGDGGSATNCSFNIPFAVATDAAGNLYIADTGNFRIRRVDASTGVITTVVGNGVSAFAGDGGSAVAASLFYPSGVAVGSTGSVFVADNNDWRVRKVDVTTSTLSFGSVNVGQTSAAQGVAVSNIGNTPLSVSPFNVSANFVLQTLGGDCTTSTPLPPGGSCNLGIAFSPTVVGNPLNGTLTIADNTPTSPQTVSLNGVGVGVPSASLSISTVAFGNQLRNKTSSRQTVTLNSVGTGDLSITGITITSTNAPDFAQTNNCPATLAPGSNCSISVTFTPSTISSETALLNIATNASGAMLVVNLSGTGFVPPPVLVSLTISPSNPVVPAGGVLQLTAVGNYSDGSAADLTSAVSWTSAQPTIASIGASAGSQELVTGVATGTDLISATVGSVSASTDLTVNFGLTGSLSTGRSLYTATQLNNGKVLIAGGIDSSGNTIPTAELYDPSTGTFTLTGALRTPREYHTATLLNDGRVLIAGGCDAGCGVQFSSAELYDPSIGTFALTGSLNTARDIHTSTLLATGKVLIAGGYGGLFGILASAEIYDPSARTFALTGNLNIAREWHVATALTTGKVLITGGYQGGLQNVGELYDPSMGTFTLTGSMNVARDVHTATVLNSGQVLIAGGWGGGSSDVTSAELYDPTSGTFGPTGNLNTARQLHTATLLSNGKVLIAGGSDTNSNYFASAELYDPSTGVFSATGNLNTARDPHTATLLNNGNVLVVGGANSSGSLASAELYVPDALAPPNLVSIAVTPTSSTADVGTAQQFTAIGTFADTTTGMLHSATWSTSDPILASITNDVTNRGTAFTLASGSTTVTACDGAICGSANLTVGTPKVSLSTITASFGSQTVGTTSTPQTIVLSNTGNGTLNISSISLVGTNSREFTESTTCGATLSSGGACNIVVAFAPSATGLRNASVTISDSSTDSPQTVSLSGTGAVATTSIAVVSSANPSVFNQPVTLTATITSSVGVPSGTITFADGSNLLGSVNASGGAASLTVSALSVAGHSITATYNGDPTHGQSVSPALTQTVGKAATTTALASSKNPQLISQPITFTATVFGQFGGAATGSAVFKNGAATLATVPLTASQISYTTSFATAGTRSITVQYSGDGNNTSNTSAVLSQSVVAKFSTTSTVVSSLNPSFIGQPVTFTATVTSAGGTPPDGELITFNRGATALGTAALSGGKATLTTSTLPTGSGNISAKYPGDTAFNASTSAALAQMVNKYPTSITFSSFSNPSSYGQSVTLTATVTSPGPAIPTGNVVFKNGTTTLATVALNSSGVATLTRTNLPTGTLALTVTYNGDTQSAPSSSGVLTQTVNPAPSTTTISSSRNPSTFGQSVRLRATVATNSGVTATGTVTFTLGSTTLGTVTLSGGSASLSTTTLPRGTDAITATYIGTANIAGSSGSITQQVN